MQPHSIHPFWVRKSFQNAMSNPITAQRLRQELNIQAKDDSTNVEFIVVGHDVGDGTVRKFAGTRPLDAADVNLRLAIIDTGYHFTGVARLIKLRVPSTDPQRCTVLCEDPNTQNKVDIGDKGLGFPYKMKGKVEFAPVAEAKFDESTIIPGLKVIQRDSRNEYKVVSVHTPAVGSSKKPLVTLTPTVNSDHTITLPLIFINNLNTVDSAWRVK